MCRRVAIGVCGGGSACGTRQWATRCRAGVGLTRSRASRRCVGTVRPGTPDAAGLRRDRRRRSARRPPPHTQPLGQRGAQCGGAVGARTRRRAGPESAHVRPVRTHRRRHRDLHRSDPLPAFLICGRHRPFHCDIAVAGGRSHRTTDRSSVRPSVRATPKRQDDRPRREAARSRRIRCGCLTS